VARSATVPNFIECGARQQSAFRVGRTLLVFVQSLFDVHKNHEAFWGLCLDSIAAGFLTGVSGKVKGGKLDAFRLLPFAFCLTFPRRGIF
jgi:hypothetical protein